MKVALASQNRRSLTPHAGKCRHFFIVDTQSDRAPQSVELDQQETLHAWPGDTGHPLDSVDVLLACTVGVGVATKLARHGIRVLATPERDLAHILDALADNTLPLSPIRSTADARSQPGACVAEKQTPAQSGQWLFGFSAGTRDKSSN